MLTLSCHNMEIKTTIWNRGFLMYKKYRCLYKRFSNSIRTTLKWFAAFERVVSQICEDTYHISQFHDVINCQ